MPENLGQRKTGLLPDQIEKTSLISIEKEPLDKGSDRRLVDRCLNGDRAAWEEFFRRFTPLILKTIQNHLLSEHRYDVIHDEDVLWDIHKRVMEKLYVDEALKQWDDLAGLWVWLKPVVITKVKDWGKKGRAKKRLPEKQEEASMLSLSTPVGKDSEETLDALIPADPAADEGVKAYIKKALQEIGSMGQEKKEWVLRLSLVFYRPLSNGEIEALSEFSGYSLKDVKARIREMIHDSVSKAKKREEEAAKAVQYWHEIRQMEKVLNYREQDREKNLAEIKPLKEKMAHLEQKRQHLLEKSREMVRPSNKAIGDLIGLRDDQVDQVSNLLDRAREDLKKKMGRAPYSRSFGGET